MSEEKNIKGNKIIKENILAKANNTIQFICPPAKARGNLKTSIL